MNICETKEDETTNFDWFCGCLPYLWPNKAPLLPLHQRRQRPTKFLPNLTISFAAPQKKQPRIPHQATMAWTKSNPSVHQSSAWNSAPTPIGAVSIFGGASQIKSKDLTDFGRFWKPTFHNQWQDMVGWCFGALFLLSLYVGHSLKHLTTSPQCSWLQGSSFK